MAIDIHERIRDSGYFPKSFDSEKIADALGRAQRFSADGGWVATLPDLIHYDCWNGPYTANTQHYVVSHDDTHKLLIMHGDGPLSDPDRLARASYEPLHRGGGIRLTRDEHDGLVIGLDDEVPFALVGDAVVPVFAYGEEHDQIRVLRNYGILMDFDLACLMPSGPQDHLTLGNNHLFMADCGWPENALRFFYMHSNESASADGGRNILFEHPYSIVDPIVPQGHFVHYGSSASGLLSDLAIKSACENSEERFCGISSGNDSIRYARFLTLCTQEDKWRADDMDPDDIARLL